MYGSQGRIGRKVKYLKEKIKIYGNQKLLEEIAELREQRKF